MSKLKRMYEEYNTSFCKHSSHMYKCKYLHENEHHDYDTML